MATSKRAPKTQTISILKIVSKFLASLTASEIDDLVSGKTQLKLSLGSAADVGRSNDDQGRPAVLEWEKLREALTGADTTEQGFAILTSIGMSRLELEQFSRFLDLPILKQDSVSRLQQKIVESLIGSRLNSKAVRGR
ncbi:hypothetical protein [Agrobacterium bohemicum]|uniref:Uncharacterized protein n=1 Tax=Agrobacterium bohemicum TaxID=2052828 RepID=A0A135P4K5_9HYPH|nr:hypothetical protein [Agrobacterium bohemicum]KXG86340.1 hypothetical protein ATO67_02545 [Agrobacterium bohemicum]